MGSDIRVLLVDPDDIDREGLKCLLREQPGFAVCAEAADARRALELAVADPPDVILIDNEALPGSCEEALDWLRRTPARSRPLLLCRNDTDPAIVELLEHGVMGIVLKSQPPAVLRKAITKIHAGEPWLDRRMIGRLLSAKSTSAARRPRGAKDNAIGRLSGREREIVSLVGKGFRNRRIADALAISDATVRNHLTSIFRKLGVRDRLELAFFAYRHGLSDAPFIHD